MELAEGTGVHEYQKPLIGKKTSEKKKNASSVNARGRGFAFGKKGGPGKVDFFKTGSPGPRGSGGLLRGGVVCHSR